MDWQTSKDLTFSNSLQFLCFFFCQKRQRDQSTGTTLDLEDLGAETSGSPSQSTIVCSPWCWRCGLHVDLLVYDWEHLPCHRTWIVDICSISDESRSNTSSRRSLQASLKVVIPSVEAFRSVSSLLVDWQIKHLFQSTVFVVFFKGKSWSSSLEVPLSGNFLLPPLAMVSISHCHISSNERRKLTICA